MQLAAINKHGLQWIAMAAVLLVGSASAAGDSFPGHEPDRRVWNIQEKVDELFDNGHYERAMFIYRNELAPLGDKYAQYMIGYMYLAGKGVAPDVITASAWYRLAAERGDNTLSGERDKLMALLNDAQKAKSDEAYAELRRELGDAALVASLIEEDLALLGDPMHLESYAERIVDRRNYGKRQVIIDEIADRVRSRMRYLNDIVAVDDSLAEADVERYSLLGERVQRELRGL
jgi:TPR repeat protein